MDVRRRRSGFTSGRNFNRLLPSLVYWPQLAYPSYQQYIVKANRAAAQQFLLEAASVQHQYLSG